jgi:hypothetical protein
MRNLIATICLTVALLLGSVGVSWSQDWLKGLAEQGNAFAQSHLKNIKTRLVSKGIDECLYKEVTKITGPESKKIVEKHCRKKLEKKSLDWLLRYAD